MSPTKQTESTKEEPKGKVQKVHLDRIVPLAETSNVRAGGLNMEHVQAMMLCLEVLPAIIVVALGGGQYGILDGYHRYQAHRLHTSTSSIKVLIVDLPEDEWFAYAVRANASHGRPLTLDEKKAAATRMLKGDRPVKDIAGDCGLSLNTVTKLGKELEEAGCSTSQNGEVEHPRVRLSQDGKRRPTHRGEAVTRAKAAADADPKASARQIAKKAGVSTGTAQQGRRLSRNPTAATSGTKPSTSSAKPARATKGGLDPELTEMVKLGEISREAAERRQLGRDLAALVSSSVGEAIRALAGYEGPGLDQSAKKTIRAVTDTYDDWVKQRTG